MAGRPSRAMWALLAVLALTMASSLPVRADTLHELRSVPDEKLIVRGSLGLRSAHSRPDDMVDLRIGLSVTPVAVPD